jgi:hypothetical protein
MARVVIAARVRPPVDRGAASVRDDLSAGLADDIGVEDEGSFDGVLRAARRGLISDDDYEVIVDAYEARARAGEASGAVDDAAPGPAGAE